MATGTSSAPPASAGRAPASIVLSTASGPVGTSVVVTGAAFAKKARGTLTAGASSVAFTTSVTGAFSSTITVAPTQGATVAIRATDGASVASASFTVTYSAVSTAPTPATIAPIPAVTTPSPSSATAQPPISMAQLRFGVSTPGGATANAELDAVASLAGESPSIVLSYYDFGQAPPIADLDSVAARGATSLITWEPWRWGGGLDQPAFANNRIIAGDYDPSLRQWGAALAGWGKPVLLRYAHEMNGNWYPWADGANANAPGSSAAAWRHVHDVVVAAGATNVQWVWSPNIPYTGSTALSGLYPGSAYVDIVALDGYNWGTAASWSSWTSPGTLFGPGLAQLRALSPGKPILIAETGSAESGGSKAVWNRDLVSYLKAQGDVMGFVWFNHNKEADWRINSSLTSANALAAALAERR
nr:glycosyl hydrolase [Glaciihabitans tibetensis]